MARGLATSLGVVMLVAACGSPAPPAPAPKAAAPAPAVAAAKPGTPAVMDPKGTIDAAKTAAGAATAATAARQEAGKPGAPAPFVAAPGTVAATAAPALATPTAKYDPAGRRDPFESQEARLGSQRSTVATARLTGLIHAGATALALVETADGIGYILKPGDTLADGRLVEIGANTAVFSIAPKPGTATNRVVLRLAGD